MMPKQTSIITLRGTINGYTYFRLKGNYYVKKKSSLNKERFDNDPAFEGSRRIANQTKITAPLAAEVYRELKNKGIKLPGIGKMIAEAGRMLRAGLSEAEIIAGLYKIYNPRNV